MEKFQSFFSHLKSYVLYLMIFLFPLFFLPTTQEIFITNKMYLFAFGGLLLLLTSTFQLLTSKKLVWQKNLFDGPVVLFLLTIILSIVISSPNKIQAILNPSFGLLSLVSLAVMYFYISRAEIKKNLLFLLQVASLILSLCTIFFFFQPFQKFNLPGYLAFLKAPGFTLLGSQIDLAIFLGFFVILGFMRIYKQISTDKQLKKQSIIPYSLFILPLLALALTIFSFLASISNFKFQISNFQLPPFTISWYAAVEILKNPVTAFFGVGVDNFASMFTKVKDILYNQSPLWQINSFTVSRSAILHIFTETGLFGLAAFGLLVFSIIKQSISTNLHKSQSVLFVLFVYLFICLLLLPPSLTLFFLFFLMLSLLAQMHGNQDIKSFSLSEVLPLYFGAILLSLIAIGAVGYLLGRTYVSEYDFKQALNGIEKNNLKELYDNQRQAIIMNPYIERYRINFSQTNLLIANNIASKGQNSESAQRTQGSAQLTEQDRQTISQAIQAAIAEAKAAVALNPQKAGNWENLAVIYRNILNVATGADVWTISAYQRAIVLDPQNALYRLGLGGVYYSLNKFVEASNLFQQTITLKPDWANGHYNLAWASFQKGDYQQAVSEIQTVLTLLNPQKDQGDYKKAQTELEEFKQKLPKPQEQASPAAQIQEPSKLNIPSPPSEKISPPIMLPKSASPEAR